jgi:putative phage-type endonuclease
MQLLNLIQGSPEWHAARAEHFCASDAPAMLGLSKYKTRTQLLTEKKTGITPEVDVGTQMLFDKGHEAEALARPLAETVIADELYPAIGTEVVEGLKLLASFDGLTMLEDKIFEHKLYNQALADFIRLNDDLPDTHWPQVEHQLLVSGADECLFITSNGKEGEQFEHITYFSKPERRARLIAGWKQFDEDLKTFEPQAKTVNPVAAPVEALPAVVVQVTGSIFVADNLPRFDAALRDYLGRINTAPETDQDFADCESAVKTLKAAEDALEQASAATIAQVEAVSVATRTIATLRELARSNRLQLEKIVKVEKENRKLQLVESAKHKAADYFMAAARQLDNILPNPPADFAGVIKGLKSLDSMLDKIDGELARFKIAVNDGANKIRANIEILNAEAKGFEFLFNDRATLLLRDADFVRLTAQSRIAEHKAEQARKEEETRARLQAEADAKAKAAADKQISDERARIQAEADERTRQAAEQTRIAMQRAEEVDRQAAQERAQIRQSEPVLSNGLTAADTEVTASVSGITAAPVANDTGARITLGQINGRLAPLSISREGLSQLGFDHVDRDRAAYLYRLADLPAIVDSLIRHLSSISLD